MDDLIIPSADEEEGLRKLRTVFEVASKYGLEIQFKNLTHFQTWEETELHTDTSQWGYGAVLLQEADDGRLHPVYYTSKKTNTAEDKYSSYELEVFASCSPEEIVSVPARAQGQDSYRLF
ncbi:transposon Tf2-9 polyprotein [Trichonephila inaurata madagascariensis]|uniref:Transposon Tf2-9 polyprotein n=1 Tax=Trichonephila inaurata madagascariensis TaxID=2747483 RepID=A0A8X6XJA0_9ARAC|nr:transposon Tf2-9 polyprotein [Trichonephila inaurata madagascariensis]